MTSQYLISEKYITSVNKLEMYNVRDAHLALNKNHSPMN